MKTSQEIHDMIEGFPLNVGESQDNAINRILDILQAMNERMDALEARLVMVEVKKIGK